MFIFYPRVNGISTGVDNYSYYGIQQNSFSLPYSFLLRYNVFNMNSLEKVDVSPNDTFVAPSCWLCVRTADLFIKDSSEIVENAVENMNDKLTEDNSNQNDINLGTHNTEMNDASDSIKKFKLI